MENRLFMAILKALDKYFPNDSRDLEWDVLPGTIGKLAEEKERLLAEVEKAERERDEARDAQLVSSLNLAMRVTEQKAVLEHVQSFLEANGFRVDDENEVDGFFEVERLVRGALKGD